MRIGWFLNAVASPTTEATPEVLSLLEEQAEGFLRSGGTLTWAEFKALTDEERAAFESAKARLTLELASAIAAIVAEWKPKSAEEIADEKIREALKQKLFVPSGTPLK